MEHLATVMVAAQFAAALALFNGIFTTLGQGHVASNAIQAIARQPEARGSIEKAMYIGLGMAETSGVYGLVVSFLLLFVNPFVGTFISMM